MVVALRASIPTLLAVLAVSMLLYAASAHAEIVHVYGRFGGLWLVGYKGEPPRPPLLNFTGAARPLLYATIPDRLVAERLSGLPVVVSRFKLVKPVETSWYRLAWVSRPPVIRAEDAVAPGDTGGEKPLMLVVVPDGLEWFGRAIARLHPGLRVLVYNWTMVMKLCGSPAEPPPGFVKPSLLEKKCGVSYNATRALCLISLERMLLGRGLRYLLLVGPASVTPPIYYYSPILEYVGIGRCQEYVPTDYWYSDPFYTWTPSVAVGRIPFGSPTLLRRYLEVLEKWIESGRRGVVAAGGALFQTTLMLGETAVYSLSKSARGAKILTLALGGYKPLALQPLMGRYALYYVASHGIGDVLLDVFPHGLLDTRVDLVLAPRQLPVNRGEPGVFVTPACLSAYWDTDVVRPPFHPPSVALALLEKGYVVDYYGSSRIAVAAIIKLSGSPGQPLQVDYLGAMRLTVLVASMLLQSKTVGEAVVKALASYSSLARGVAIAYTPYGSEDIAVLTMLEFELLGDPAAPAPMGSGGYTPPPTPVIRYNDTVPLVAVYPSIGEIVSGRLPLVVEPPGKPLVVTVSKCPDRAVLVTVARYEGTVLAYIEARDAVVEKVGGRCRIVAPVSPGPSLHYLILEYNGVVERIPVLLAYFNATPLNGAIRVAGYGLDLLRVTGDEPIGVYVDGRLEAWIPGGIDAYNTTIRGVYGRVRVELRPWRSYQRLAYGPGTSSDIYRIINRWFAVNTTVPYVRVRYTPLGVLVELMGYRLVAVKGGTAERLTNNTILVRASKPFTLILEAYGRTTRLTIPAAYPANTTATPRSTTSTTAVHGGEIATQSPTATGTTSSTGAVPVKAASTTGVTIAPSIPPALLVSTAIAAITALVSFTAVYAATARRRRTA